MKTFYAISLFSLILSWSAGLRAETPVLRYVMDIHAECGEPLAVGDVPGGKRVVIPITGGRVEGDISGEILPGGADYQMTYTLNGRTEFRAVYTVRTSDSLLVNVCNTGVATWGGKGDYFTTTPQFEAPEASGIGWLNDRIFVCRPTGFGDGVVHLRVWVVE